MQKNCNNVPTKSISQFFEKVGTIPLLDHLTVETDGRFDNASISVYSGLAIIPSKMVSLVYKMLRGKKNLIYLLIFSKMTFHASSRWRQNFRYGKQSGCKLIVIFEAVSQTC